MSGQGDRARSQSEINELRAQITKLTDQFGDRERLYPVTLFGWNRIHIVEDLIALFLRWDESKDQKGDEK